MGDKKKQQSSLADLASQEADISKLSPEMRQAVGAVRESARRNPGNSVWTDRRKARGKGFPFWLPKGEKRRVLFLSEPKVVVAHKFTVGWNTRNGNSFPDTEWGVCDQYVPSTNPDQEAFDKTGKPCAACMALGEPRTVMAFIICEFFKEPVKIQNRMVTHQVRLLIADSLTPQNQLIDNALTDTAGGSLKFCLVDISRSQNNQSPRIGDSFTVKSKLTQKQIMGDPNAKSIIEAVKAIDLDKAYAPLSLEEFKTALTRHKQVNDKHCEGDNYDPEGMAKALRGQLERDDERKKDDEVSGGTSLADLASSGGSLGSLADIEEGSTEDEDSDEDTSFDIGGDSEESDDEEELEAPDIWN